MKTNDAFINIPKAMASIKEYVARKEQDGTAHLGAGHITIEYRGRLTNEVKEAGVKKDYNAYGRLCNVAGTITVNSNIGEVEDMVQEYLKNYGLQDTFVATTRLV